MDQTHLPPLEQRLRVLREVTSESLVRELLAEAANFIEQHKARSSPDNLMILAGMANRARQQEEEARAHELARVLERVLEPHVHQAMMGWHEFGLRDRFIAAALPAAMALFPTNRHDAARTAIEVAGAVMAARKGKS